MTETVKVPVDKCPAGPAMDMAVAEAVGYECVCYEPDNAPFDCPIHSDDPDVKFRYSTDIAAAWGLVEILIQGHEFYITNYYNPDGWSANHRRNAGLEWNSTDADTAPLAISRAFLKANGVEYVEVPE